MKIIRKTSDLVKTILEEEPKARNSFSHLYYMICLKKNPKVLGMTFAQVLMNMKDLKLPPFESVRRSRQKLQAEYPELAGSDEVEGFRTELEEKYKDYARAVNV